MTSCLQYYYENTEDAEKYKINCEGKIFPALNDVNTFKNTDLLNFINEQYSDAAFPENSPFEFSSDYINMSSDNICKSVEMSLAPQQKFMGQLMGPNTNFNNMLVFHGLGSGKSCTSIVIGEALKNATNQRLLYAVPAPLIDQYFEEISGEIRNGKFFACPSFCVVLKGDKYERDFYVSQPRNAILTARMKAIDTETNILFEIEKEIDLGDNSAATQKRFSDQQNKVNVLKRQLKAYQTELRGNIARTFEIVSHNTFVDSIYKTGKDGQLIKNNRLLEDSALFHKNGLLVIDEIQRLVSESGIFYKKLYNAIKYYFHPNLRIALLTATPIYDNPYELALTINLLRPRVPFPTSKSTFYKYFIGVTNDQDECVQSENDYITPRSCILNKELLSYICSGYVSYFKGGNPNAYPYKRIITMQHTFSAPHKSEYISALKSDVSKDKNLFSDNSLSSYENVLLGDYNSENEDKVSGMYVITQQYSNIFLPSVTGKGVNTTVAEKKESLQIFKRNITALKGKSIQEIIEYVKQFSTKFASIIELTLSSNGPVFIFSNWLTYGVEPLAIILEACGLVSFEKENKGMGKFFIWSSDTKTKDKDGTLIKKARNTFNSMENNTGELLKVILGTRSVMEGVSFKNVKQVHITDPWWNESRIEQILARASRYCSHSSLPADEQYVDIYRHYSSLPTSGIDPDVSAMLNELSKGEDFKGLASSSIDERMLMISLKKNDINKDLEVLLKNCSVDSKLNRNGNIIRLEENVIPYGGMYQIFYKNPSTGRLYIREGVPEAVSFDDIYTRKYSFPNTDLPIKFTEAVQTETGEFETFSDSEILTEPQINKDLNVYEQITPWDSNKTFNDLDLTDDIRTYMNNLTKNYLLIPTLRKNYFNETGTDVIKFKDDTLKRIKLIKCIKELSAKNLVSDSVKKDIAKEFNKDSRKQQINAKVLELIYTYKIYPESYLEELLQVGIDNPRVIDEALKNVKNSKASAM